MSDLSAMAPRPSGNLALAAWVCLFVLSGIGSPMLVTRIRFAFGPPAKTLWPLYPLYLGNLLAGAFSAPASRPQWRDASRLFGLDLAAQSFANLGLLTIGPPLFAIFYKSVTVFTGLLSMCLLPPTSHPSRRQWLAMVLITAGLAVQGSLGWRALGAKEVFGAALVIVGCLFWAAGAVISELYLGGGARAERLGPLQVAWVLGLEGCVASGIWAACTVRGPPMPLGFWWLFLLLVLTSAAHQAAWFLLVGRLGACATAVLKAFQSVCLFLGASAAFCARDRDECMTADKVCSFVIVSVGVLVYSFPAAASPQREELAAETVSLVGAERGK
mmetsp:Transcript_21006/g.66333  ORF Transcript_21006/g.66333 Transcript_21006/m.66333 type:complete len:330 (+) Transcript_21006:85-1074(+)